MSDEAILERLVALNAERAAEESRGHIRWLRPDYQAARAGIAAAPKATQMEADLIAPVDVQKVAFPAKAVEQTAAIMVALSGQKEPLPVAALAARYRQGKRAEPRVAATLAALSRMGYVTETPEGFMLRG